MDTQRGIAIGPHIPWDIPSDQQYFRDQTADSTILMGYRTYETFQAPLPGRRNIVWCYPDTKLRDGFEPAHDLATFFAHEPDTWVIGGGELYEAALSYCQELYITQVPGDYQCTVFFPEFQDDFELVDTDPQPEGHDYTIWRRKVA